MNIDELIKREAPDNDKHDFYYKKALRDSYSRYKHMPLLKLKEAQVIARRNYDLEHCTHSLTADCIVLLELITGALEVA